MFPLRNGCISFAKMLVFQAVGKLRWCFFRRWSTSKLPQKMIPSWLNRIESSLKWWVTISDLSLKGCLGLLTTLNIGFCTLLLAMPRSVSQLLVIHNKVTTSTRAAAAVLQQPIRSPCCSSLQLQVTVVASPIPGAGWRWWSHCGNSTSQPLERLAQRLRPVLAVEWSQKSMVKCVLAHHAQYVCLMVGIGWSWQQWR